MPTTKVERRFQTQEWTASQWTGAKDILAGFAKSMVFLSPFVYPAGMEVLLELLDKALDDTFTWTGKHNERLALLCLQEIRACLYDTFYEKGVPESAVLYLAVLDRQPCIWLMVNTDEPEVRKVLVVPITTGQDFQPQRWTYIGSVALDARTFVVHYFICEEGTKTDETDTGAQVVEGTTEGGGG